MKLSRAFLAGFAVLGLLPVSETVDASAAPALSGRFVPPAGELVLTRTVVRYLSGGKQIVVSRHYRISFAAEGSGYRIDGTLLGVEVEAPPMLSSLADLERNRQDTGLFPMWLSGNGMIQDQNTAEVDRGQRQQTFAAASALIGASEADPDKRARSTGPLGHLVLESPNSAWPTDLFYAQPGERHFERHVKLEDGSEGTVEVVLAVAAPLHGGLPQRFERTITTTIAGTKRVSREIFTIAAGPA